MRELLINNFLPNNLLSNIHLREGVEIVSASTTGEPNTIQIAGKLTVTGTSEYPVKFISIDKLTEGTACTVLFAREYINNSSPLLIANSDQIIDSDINEFIFDSRARGLDGSILTFIDHELNPKWSFAEIDSNGFVLRVKEKEAISNIATVGIYLFSKGSDFVDGAVDMIINNDRINNEFYTCPVYNYSIQDAKKIMSRQLIGKRSVALQRVVIMVEAIHLILIILMQIFRDLDMFLMRMYLNLITHLAKMQVEII